MKKILVAAAVTLMCGAAFAQTGTGPAAQSDDTSKRGVTNGTMDHGSKGKGAMNKGSGTTTGMITTVSGDSSLVPGLLVIKDAQLEMRALGLEFFELIGQEGKRIGARGSGHGLS